MRTQKATLPYARIPRALLWMDALSPLAIKILMWVQTLNDEDVSYKRSTEKKLISLWKNEKRAQIVKAIKELRDVGLLSSKRVRHNNKWCGCVYRFATYKDIEDLCRRYKQELTPTTRQGTKEPGTDEQTTKN